MARTATPRYVEQHLPGFAPPKNRCPFVNCPGNGNSEATVRGRGPNGVVYSRLMCAVCLDNLVQNYGWSPAPKEDNA